MANDIVSRLENRIDELLGFQAQLLAENGRLKRAKNNLQTERKRCRRELDTILSKLDHLGKDRR